MVAESLNMLHKLSPLHFSTIKAFSVHSCIAFEVIGADHGNVTDHRILMV